MRLLPPAEGEDVLVRKKRIPFTFWPTFRDTRREGLQWTLFASDPWFLIENKVRSLSASARGEAIAFLLQARDFYQAATDSNINAAKPLLLYYAFLNLAKCYIVFQAQAPFGSRVVHGLSEKLPTTPGAIYGDVHILRAMDATSAFAKFSAALGDQLPAANVANNTVSVRSQDFLAQVLIGHRVWCKGEHIKERFISLQELCYRHDPHTKNIWLRARIYKDDLSRFEYSQTATAKAFNIGGGGAFHGVTCTEVGDDDRPLLEFELTNKTTYANRPSEELLPLALLVRRSLWRSVTSYPPYRKYYIYLPTSSQVLVSQLQSLYLAIYYFGSITRYKPQNFNEILESPIGPFVQEFFTNQPSQILYLMASEFVKQEVTKAAIA